ncbi:MAG TPA: FAD-binding oxidoreductase [Chitinophagaceae bacterium]|nr:FAD-binding oxidoreductase [Chitinophagaceae bacterium]
MKKKIANWGNYPVVISEEQSFTLEEEARASLEGMDSVIGRGNGRCYGDASLGDTTFGTLKFDKVLSFDRGQGIFTCESGITLDQILKIIVPSGWFLPVTPGTKFITVGGAVASDVHGKNHHVDGAFSNHVVSMDILVASGKVLTCSGSLLPDLFEATCGGMGLTGLILRVSFRLKKIESSYIRQKQIKATNLDHVLSLFEQYRHYTYSVAWIDCLKKGNHFGRSILILGEHATRSELSPSQTRDPLKLPRQTQFVFPFTMPSFVLNPITVKAFNFLVYNKNFMPEMDSVVSYEPFFYPLDSFLHWNRAYGKAGFVQYQFVLPFESKTALIEIMTKISDQGMGSFLTVLKTFGPQQSIISFPMEGYTLAMDFPVRRGLFAFLDQLDRIVLEHGGRIYLSKDARMSPEVFWNSYRDADRFMEIVRRYNPEYKFRSMQSDRLLLTKI